MQRSYNFFNSFMNEALLEAKKAFDKDEVPVGAIIYDNKSQNIIARCHNQNRLLKDSTAHAEILAIRLACKVRNSSFLDGCDIYVTLEPCPMCAWAISLARINRLYYALCDPKSGAIENGSKIFQSQLCSHKPEIYSDINWQESKQLLQDFFIQKR